MTPLLLWVCGPYAGDGTDEAARAANLHRLNLAALEVLRRGHLPVIGINLALPIIRAAGGDDAATEIRRPLSLALLERCDACLRVGGASRGADEEAARFLATGRAVYRDAGDLPVLTPVGSMIA